MDPDLDSNLIKEKLNEYTKFVTNVLRPKYDDAKFDENTIKREIDEYKELAQKLKDVFITKNNNTASDTTTNIIQVNLGHEKVFCNATYYIDDINNSKNNNKSRPVDENKNEEQLEKQSLIIPNVFVDIGMGIHVEMTINEGIKFCQKRINFLTENKLSNRIKKTKQIEYHMNQSNIIINELSRELARMKF